MVEKGQDRAWWAWLEELDGVLGDRLVGLLAGLDKGMNE
jgi:hypothetical protein